MNFEIAIGPSVEIQVIAFAYFMSRTIQRLRFHSLATDTLPVRASRKTSHEQWG